MFTFFGHSSNLMVLHKVASGMEVWDYNMLNLQLNQMLSNPLIMTHNWITFL